MGSNVNHEESAEEPQLAVIILAYSDYESLELSLAVHSKFLPLYIQGKRVKLYILQNGRSSYDCERTYLVAKRYETLWPKDIEVVDWILPGMPYLTIGELLNSEKFKNYQFIVKIDDDVFPLTADWLQSLWNCFRNSMQKYNDRLAYVTCLVNNNPWGFKKTLEVMGIEREYFDQIAREHLVGNTPDDQYSSYKICSKDEIYTGGFGTIWRYSYIARWLHQKTTMQPDLFIEKTKNLGYQLIQSYDRYSINCILFAKEKWFEIDDGDTDDEFMWQKYCLSKNKIIIADLSVPMCHLFFMTQRFENKDLITDIRRIYSKWLSLPFPISLNEDRVFENEERLKFIEARNWEMTRKLDALESRQSKNEETLKEIECRLLALQKKTPGGIIMYIREKTKQKLKNHPRAYRFARWTYQNIFRGLL